MSVFSRPALAQVVLDSWQFLQDQARTTLLGYVIMENHLHFIARATDIVKEVGDFKSFTARKSIDWLGAKQEWALLQQLEFYRERHKRDRNYQFWQGGSHPKQIDCDETMWQKLEYMHNNPVKRGYVDDPLHWRYSSARNYARLNGLVSVTTDW